MRKLIFQMLISLDGYYEGSNKEIDWHNVDKEFNDSADEFLKKTGGLIFGRVTYELMANYWPTQSAINDDPIIAKWMNDLPKFIFSTSLKDVDWKNSTLIKGNAADEVRKLKEQPGKGLAIFGSSDLALSLIEHGLIDEFHIIISPIILGKGKPLFKGITNRLKLKLIKTKAFKNGNVLLVYKPD